MRVMDKERVRDFKIVLEFMECWILFIEHFSNEYILKSWLFIFYIYAYIFIHQIIIS